MIDDHLDACTRTVLEGDYLLPRTASGHGGLVVGVMLVDPEASAIESNYGIREPGEEHGVRSEVSVLLGEALAEMATATGMPVISARPWNDAVARVEAALASC